MIGKLIYNFYYKPKAFFNRIKKQGLVNSIITERQHQKMKHKASGLHEVFTPDLPLQHVYFLTGQKYWHQTSFCLYSLQKASKRVQFAGIFIDDGSINQQLQSQIRHQFPNSKLILKDEIEALLDKYLPLAQYPEIRKKRQTYPHLKKLTDVHAGVTGWKMVLDSDMLFFNNPLQIADWLQNPAHPFFLQDAVNSYHYSFGLMESLTGKKMHPKLNVGAVGLKSEDISWGKLENWIKTLEENEGSSYLLEQALSAMLVAGSNVFIADSNRYIVMPNKSDVENPDATLHHYVDQSKEWYYKTAWQKVI